MEIQCSTDIDAKLPDGILGFYKRVNGKEIKDHRAVIELKGPQVLLDKDQKREGTTYKSPVDQSFSYTNKLDGCKWVIISNFVETRLYKVGRSKEYYKVFHLDDLGNKDNFKKFYYLMHKDNLINKTGKSLTMELSEATHKRQEDISVELYNIYKNLRINLFEHLRETNEDLNPELLLEKAQKFLDRIIFICFCEDKGLLSNDLLHEAIQRGKESFSVSENPVWDQIKGVFRAINEGGSTHNINSYNGGLFEYDKVLDELIIEDEFFEAIYKISNYDFDSDVDVNILGHIFEQSIADIEKIKSDINENEFDKENSKRKKEGIYYTPKYITSYIVENAVGGYLEDIKEELGYNELPDIAEANSKSWESRYTKQHLDFYGKYEERLKDIKILDPACGSGAFLNQAFDYLLKEHQWLNKQRDILKDRYMSIDSLESMQKNILKNNLFGVDLNEESVEITKLSLWLKTANKNKPLTNLDDNIKCGNSLIDDTEVAGEKAFNWEDEFKEIISSGGFDVIVGNPPYVKKQNLSKNKMINYYEDNYESAFYNFDLYMLFVEKGASLINTKGYMGYILPSKFTTTKTGTGLRKLIEREYFIERYVDFDDYQVFKDATTYTCLLFLTKQKGKDKTTYLKINKNAPLKISSYNNSKVAINKTSTSWDFSEKAVELSKKTDSIKLQEIAKTFTGIETGLDKIFIINRDEKGYTKFLKYEGEIVHKVLKGKNLERYWFNDKEYIVIVSYDNNGNLISLQNIKNKYPEIYHYLEKHKKKLENRESGKMNTKKWYGYVYPKNLNKYNNERLIWPDIATYPRFSLDNNTFDWHVRTVGSLELYKDYKEHFDLHYLLGIFNSKVFYYFIQKHSNVVRGGYFRYRPQYILEFPIPKNIKNNKQIKIKKLVEKAIETKKVYKKNQGLGFMKLVKKLTSFQGETIGKIIKKFSSPPKPLVEF